MSYDVSFIKGARITSEMVEEILAFEASPQDEHFISKALKDEVKIALKERGLRFEVFEESKEEYVELNFETYQISMFDSEISISLPYWDENGSGKIKDELHEIARILIEKGFTGYNVQTGVLFNEPELILSDFERTSRDIREYLSQNAGDGKKSDPWRLLKVGLIFGLVFFAIKFFASLIEKSLK